MRGSIRSRTIRSGCSRLVQRIGGFAVGRRDHLVLLESQVVRDRSQDAGIVFDDEHFRHACACRGMRTENVLPRPGSLTTAMRPAVRLDDVERQRQSQARSGDARVSCRLDAVEPLEDARLLVSCDADAVVDDVHERLVVAGADAHLDASRVA